MINIAIVGCGYWGPNLARVFSQVKGSRLHTCCDLDKSRLDKIKSNYPYINTTTDFDEVIKNKEIDAIVLAVPVEYHHPLAKKTLMNDKHVLIEKPMTKTVEEAQELIDLAKQKKKVLMVGYTFEYAPAIRKIKNIVKNGELGEIYYITTNWLNLGILQPDVNVIFDLATHLFTAINYITGLSPISIRAIGQSYIRDNNEEMAAVFLKYPKKIVATVNVSWLEPCKVRRMTIVGSKKMLVFDLQDKSEQIKIYDKGVDINDLDNKVSYRSGDIYSPKIDVDEPLFEEAKHFVECIKEDKTPLTDGKRGLEVVHILECADKSLKNNGSEIMI
jgi:predicted dehydrogenase